MIEWVNCLKLKLRELKILSPKENIYTKPPEMKPNLQSTRNPRDPLPQRPINHVSAEIPPGLEVSQQETSIETDDHVEALVQALTTLTEDATEDSVLIDVHHFSTSNTTSQNLINLLSNPLRHTTNVTAFNDLFENVPNPEDDDELEVLPTSLQIDYIPNEDEHQQLLQRDNNITVIKIAENENLSQSQKAKEVTKIKIEIEYDQLCMASSLPVDVPEVNEIDKTNENEAGAVHQPSTSHLSVEPVIEPSLSHTPRKTLETIKHTPIHEKRKLSLREKQVKQLTLEINTEIRFKLRKKDCVDALAFVTALGSIWIAGFKSNPVLYCLHVGDQLLAINNIVTRSPADAQKYIKMCSGLFVEVTIRRLPLAKIFLIRREFEGQCLGIIRDGSSPVIVEIIPNSISSHIPTRPSSRTEDSTWIITQINFRNISLISQKKFDETELLLNSSGLEMSLLLQPSDFIAKIKKELKAMKNYRDYTLQ